MPITFDTPVEKQVAAPVQLNTFEILRHEVHSRPESAEGPLVLVHCRGLLRETSTVEREVTPATNETPAVTETVDVVADSNVTLFPPMAYEGARLAAIMAEAGAKTAALIDQGATADVAIYVGIRDALYTALRADGIIPAS
jgi:hypothetical protein